MREVGRNESCPCGSGRKHKRCCLEIERAALRIAAAAEARILELGHRLRDEDTRAWVEAYERDFGPLNRFGTVPAEFAAWLDLRLVCDEPLADGRTALDAAADRDPQAADRWLAQSALAGWWLGGAEFPAAASPWREERALTLHCRSEPMGALAEGALLIGRGVAVGDGHVAIIGRPVVVAEDVVGEVMEVLAQRPGDALVAALRWPEWREHTAEGDVVQQCHRCYSLNDPEAALEAFQAHPLASARDVAGYWEDDVTFAIAGPSVVAPVEPAPQPGVRWDLCEEDRQTPRVLAEVTISPDDAELHVTAPTRSRVEQAMAALPAAVTSGLGEPAYDDLDAPDVLPRMSRERLERLLPLGGASTAEAARAA